MVKKSIFSRRNPAGGGTRFLKSLCLIIWRSQNSVPLSQPPFILGNLVSPAGFLLQKASVLATCKTSDRESVRVKTVIFNIIPDYNHTLTLSCLYKSKTFPMWNIWKVVKFRYTKLCFHYRVCPHCSSDWHIQHGIKLNIHTVTVNVSPGSLWRPSSR